MQICRAHNPVHVVAEASAQQHEGVWLLRQVVTQTYVCFTVFHSHVTAWGVEPVMIHQTSWLVSTGACDVRQDQAAEHSAQKSLIAFCQ